MTVEHLYNETQLWHKRFGHIRFEALRKFMTNKMVQRQENVTLNKIEFCEACVKGKTIRLKFTTRSDFRGLL